MLYREIIAVCSEIHTKHINTLRGQNAELLNVKLAVGKVLHGVEDTADLRLNFSICTVDKRSVKWLVEYALDESLLNSSCTQRNCSSQLCA
jgi:hypothetical protein